ncbi:MAG: flagellar hook protein FlgE [Roseibaca calidilacus]|uniref:Flagellar hook protein FlgE n=1 Tax=Roseibaca calidilacus TaxID=1666912 RepID=A0A0P7YXB9_9RHOB|nr:flagellar hook protein FlgE [Roseibaca calidilacus]KPP95578.1 MAG: flagellar hook protein FlgE [Roseibaca calidilacus]CUX82060.1 flagellar hook protein FlgE [Roseibaca calidilacus]
MSMSTALSGLHAAQRSISVTSHNIANVGTTGFRGSRAEFADIFTQSPFSVARTTAGSGTQITRVAQDFSQGSVVGTGNRLDLAIEGPGFFAMRAESTMPGVANETVYSRAGAFSMSADGHIVNSSGQQLMGWPVAQNGQVLSEALGSAQAMNVPLTMGTPMATSETSLELRLPSDPTMSGSQAAIPPIEAFDPANPETYAHRTQLPLFDENGNAVEAELYLVRESSASPTDPNTEFTAYVMRDGVMMDATGDSTLTFAADGSLVAPEGALGFDSAAGALSMSFDGSSLGAEPFAVESVVQDGQTVGQLTTLDIDSEGTVWASYGANDRVAVGKLLLVNFPNPGELRPLGAATFGAQADAGEPLAGSPGGTGFGRLRSGALEMANVDLTEELVDLITAQRNYQANAKSMETSSQMMQTIMNIRS